MGGDCGETVGSAEGRRAGCVEGNAGDVGEVDAGDVDTGRIVRRCRPTEIEGRRTQARQLGIAEGQVAAGAVADTDGAGDAALEGDRAGGGEDSVPPAISLYWGALTTISAALAIVTAPPWVRKSSKPPITPVASASTLKTASPTVVVSVSAPMNVMPSLALNSTDP
ncbi:MAG: hypothetical protein R3F55_24635 [Alphaproteobacteria bacterium]